MFNVGGGEVLVILLVALLVLGPTRLPQAARQVGQFMGEFRRIASGFQQELRTALDEDPALQGDAKPTTKPKSSGGPTDQRRVIDTNGSEANGKEATGSTDDPAASAAGDTTD